MSLKKIISVKGIMVAAAALLLFACKPEPVAVTGITLNAKELNLQPGVTAVLTATVEPKEAVYGTIAWSVSPKDTVKLTVDQKKKGPCTVEALKEGKATVTAIVDGLRSVQCPVAVNYKSITNTAFIEALDTRAKDRSGKKVTVGWTKEPDGTVKLTPENLEKIRAVTKLDISGYDIAVEERLSDLSGIEYFTGLTYLSCSGNQLTELDVTKNTALTDLSCSGNQLTELDVTNNTELTYLDCYNNNLTELDVTKNTALTDLKCYDNNLAELDVTKNTALINLSCYENQLAALDVTKNTALTLLQCFENRLTELDVTNNTELTYLDCEDQSISSLDVSQNTKLKQLWCGGNDLAELDITNNTALATLCCGNQTSDGSATQDLALTLTAAQKTTWESKWSSSSRNTNVTATVKTTE